MKISGCVVALMCCLASFVAVAEDAAAPQTNDPAQVVLVTATRIPRPAQSVPATVHRIDVEDKTATGAAVTTPQLFAGLPSEMDQKTACGQGSPYLRGFTGFRTLLLIDGFRLNNSVFRDGPNQYWSTVDPLSLKGAEVVMGPASALYGSDAVGGTANVNPVTPPAYEGEPTWRRRLYFRGATAEESGTGRIQVGARPSEEWGLVGGFTARSFGDLRGGREVGKQPRTGYDEWGGDARAEYRPDADTLLAFGHQHVTQNDVWRTHKTVYGTDWEGLAVGDEKVRSLDQRRDLTYARLRVGNLGGFAETAELRLARHAQSESQYRLKKDDTSDASGFDVVTWSAGIQLESPSPLGQWVYGVDYDRDGVDSHLRKYRADGSFKGEDLQGPVADEASYDSLGLFAQNTVELWDGGPELTPGLRASRFEADADEVLDPATGESTSLRDEWDALTASLRALVPLARDRSHVLYASAAQGFRAPNLSDLTRLDTARSNEYEIPSLDLDPEDYVSCEAGIKSRVERLTLQAAVYHTWIDGMIVRTPTGSTRDGLIEVIKKNAGDGHVQGAEASAEWRCSDDWTARVSGSVLDGRVDSYPSADAEPREDYISRLMPPALAAALRWQQRGGRLWIEGAADAAARADKLSDDDRRDTQRIPPGGTPGYAVCHLRSGLRVSDALTLGFALENILDHDYRIHGSGVNEPGRNFVVTATADF